MTVKSEPQRVLAPEVARTVRRALAEVVAKGTASRLREVYQASDGGACWGSEERRAPATIASISSLPAAG